MKLYDEEELRIKNEKNKKMKNLILVSIILTVVLIVLLMGVIYYLIYNPNKITIRIDGIEDEKVEEMLITKNDYDGNTIVYFPIRKIASRFGYSSNNGDYKRNVENTENCYIESENEVAIFTENMNTIYKIDKTIQKSNDDYEYEKVELENPIIKENDLLYVDIEGLEKAFNLYIDTNNKMKRISITTLNTLVSSAEKKITENKYGVLDEKFSNRKALLENMMVIESETEGKKGVIDFSNKNEILGFQYDDITYIPSNESFLIKKDDKVGIIGSDKIVKIKPQFDSLTLIDSNNGLYLAEDTSFFGVIDENQNSKIYFEYKKIGVDLSQFKENNIKNGYVLFNRFIPVQRDDGQWLVYRIDVTEDSNGNKNVQCNPILPNITFQNIGCVVPNANFKGIVNNLLGIEEYNLIVVQRYDKYGFLDLKGEAVLGLKYANAFLGTESGVTDYYATKLNGEQIKIKDELNKIQYNKID